MRTATRTREIPEDVLMLLQRAVGADLLTSVEAMAAALSRDRVGW